MSQWLFSGFLCLQPPFLYTVQLFPSLTAVTEMTVTAVSRSAEPPFLLKKIKSQAEDKDLASEML